MSGLLMLDTNAAHAMAEGATLITADRAFAHVRGLAIQDYEQV